jgi:hypothetical protein
MAFFGIIFYRVLARYAISVDTQINNQAKIINLIAHIAKQNGATDEDIDILTLKKKNNYFCTFYKKSCFE